MDLLPALTTRALVAGGIALALGVASPAQAQLETLSLTDAPASLVGSGDQRLGEVLLAADLNGDGLEDLAVGSPSTATVRVFINSGSGLGWLTLDSPTLTIFGDAGTELGASLAATTKGPWTSSIYLVVGIPGGSVEGVVTGQIALFQIDDSRQDAAATPDQASALVSGPVEGGRFGAAVVELPGASGDGTGHLLVGAPGVSTDQLGGAVYLLTAEDVSARTAAAALRWGYQGAAGEAGASLAVGDFNGDSTVDVAVGAPSAPSGRVFFVSGAKQGASGNLQDLGTKLDGIAQGDRFGAALATTPPLTYSSGVTRGDNLLIATPNAAAGGTVDLVNGGLALSDSGTTLSNARLAGIHGDSIPMGLGTSLAWVGALVPGVSPGFAAGAPSYTAEANGDAGGVFFVPVNAKLGASRVSVLGVARALFIGSRAGIRAGQAVSALAASPGAAGLVIGAPSQGGAATPSRVAVFPDAWFSENATDFDGDGYDSTTDCDDANADVNPGIAETCDGQSGARVDTDCDGNVDEGLLSESYGDGDGDGYGQGQPEVVAGCDPAEGGASQGGDCDDSNADAYPGATEACGGGDEDCDGSVDEGLSSGIWYTDADGDGYGDPQTGAQTCEPSEGDVQQGGDCDDTSIITYPGAPEACDGDDNDCDSIPDEGAAVDADGDTYTTCDGDCDDTDASAFPGNPEVCDLADNDCNGTVDDGFDADGDGYPVGAGCPSPVDCDDSRAAVNPGAQEVCSDSLDNDCDGQVDPIDLCGDSPDADFDGYTVAEGDCDDSDPAIYPGGAERCDGKDNNCDGSLREDEVDADGDHSYTCQGTLPPDCDDTDATVYPNAPELCDGQGNGCTNGVQSDTPTDERDRDGDGYLACTGCSDGMCGDCDDRVAETLPGADELCDGADNDCDGHVDEGLDGDGDGVLSIECGGADCDDTDGSINPSADEILGNDVDEDCDEVAADVDGDGYCLDPSDANGCQALPDCDDGDASIHPGASDPEGDGIDQACDGDPTPEPTATPEETPEVTPTPYPPPVVRSPGLGGGDGVDGLAFSCSQAPGPGASAAWALLLLAALGLRRRR